MHEKVSIALVRGDESIALLIVEPLDRTGGHALVPSPLPTAPVSLRDPCTRLHFLPDSVRMPRQKYHPTRLEGGVPNRNSSGPGRWPYQGLLRGTSEPRSADPRSRTAAPRSPPPGRRRRVPHVADRRAPFAWWPRSPGWARRRASSRTRASRRAAA